MKVRMKEDKSGSPDGINVIEYKKGKTYDLPKELAEAWIDRELAVAVKGKAPKETKVEEPEETKVDEPEEQQEPPGPEEPEEKEPPETKDKKKK